MATATERRRRATDDGWACKVAQRLREFWDWVDRRQIDAYFISFAILYGTTIITDWAMRFAENGNRPGIEIAAIIGAVVAPYMAMQGAAIKFLFDARQKTFLPPK